MTFMPTRTNFAAPEYEPTDEDLAEGMREAFAGLSEAREQSLREMRARIAVAQGEARKTLSYLLRQTPKTS